MLTYDDLVQLSASATFEIPRTSKHVAVLMNKSRIEGVFANQYARHAEEVAVAFYLSHLHNKRRSLKLYIGRLTCHNKMSRPCKHCSLMLRQFPNIRVFYTNETGTWIEEDNYSSIHISHRRRMLGYSR